MPWEIAFMPDGSALVTERPGRAPAHAPAQAAPRAAGADRGLVAEAPDGSLVVLTNNRDGRGSPRGGDDRILRIVLPAD